MLVAFMWLGIQRGTLKTGLDNDVEVTCTRLPMPTQMENQ